MTITATVENNQIALPPGVDLPDGTVVEIVLPADREATLVGERTVRLPTFKGDGLQPGVDLADSRSLRELLGTTLSGVPAGLW